MKNKTIIVEPDKPAQLANKIIIRISREHMLPMFTNQDFDKLAEIIADEIHLDIVEETLRSPTRVSDF